MNIIFSFFKTIKFIDTQDQSNAMDNVIRVNLVGKISAKSGSKQVYNYFYSEVSCARFAYATKHCAS